MIYILQDSLVPPIPGTFQAHSRTLEFILKEIENGQKSLVIILDLISKFNDAAIDNSKLVKLQTSVKKLLQQCYSTLQGLDEKSLLQILQKYDVSWDSFYQIAENFVIEHIYEILFFKVTSFYKEKDAALAAILSQALYLDPSHLGIDFQSCTALPQAIKKIQALPVLRTPSEKINCVVQAMHALTKNGMSRSS
jgi:hypothetical protein